MYCGKFATGGVTAVLETLGPAGSVRIGENAGPKNPLKIGKAQILGANCVIAFALHWRGNCGSGFNGVVVKSARSATARSIMSDAK